MANRTYDSFLRVRAYEHIQPVMCGRLLEIKRQTYVSVRSLPFSSLRISLVASSDAVAAFLPHQFSHQFLGNFWELHCKGVLWRNCNIFTHICTLLWTDKTLLHKHLTKQNRSTECWASAHNKKKSSDFFLRHTPWKQVVNKTRFWYLVCVYLL